MGEEGEVAGLSWGSESWGDVGQGVCVCMKDL